LRDTWRADECAQGERDREHANHDFPLNLEMNVQHFLGFTYVRWLWGQHVVKEAAAAAIRRDWMGAPLPNINRNCARKPTAGSSLGGQQRCHGCAAQRVLFP
jgi:hypothetical protein